ncbi:MAG: hypothetical protein CVU64_14790 [Deltaproteobacteria bacterium HGW-Deltaproteobacteria-21]|nr:MAG: hypothetical protein CVU64_14790 [Deltaproteobacteria bacterium HGW-Deltaproteobacteria-21]
MDPKDRRETSAGQRMAFDDHLLTNISSQRRSRPLDGLYGVKILDALRFVLDRAQTFYLQGDYKRAEAEVSEVLKTFAESSERGLRSMESLALKASALTRRGLLLEQLRQSADSVRTFQEAIELFDQSLSKLGRPSPQDLAHYGITLFKMNRNDEATDYLQRATDLGYATAETLQYLGNAYEAQSKLNEAVFAYSNAAKELMISGKLSDALPVLDRVCMLNPRAESALLDKADVLFRLGRDEEALETFDKALELSPDSAWVLGRKGETLRMLNRYEESLQVLDKALELSPEDAWTLMVKGAVYCGAAQYEDALNLLERALELNPSDSWSFGFKGLALERVRKPDDAMKAYEAAINLDPENFAWQIGKADSLYIMGQIEEASKKYSSVIDNARKRPADVDTLSQIAWCNYRLNAYDEAVRLYRQALSLDVESVSIKFNIALAFLCSGRLELGLQEYRKGIDMSQGKSLLYRRGVLHETLRYLNEARQAQAISMQEKECVEVFDLLQEESKKTLQDTPLPCK